jgi:hypothetical protein
VAHCEHNRTCASVADYIKWRTEDSIGVRTPSQGLSQRASTDKVLIIRCMHEQFQIVETSDLLYVIILYVVKVGAGRLLS